jgi:uncharacterized protein (TIGR02996 family)
MTNAVARTGPMKRLPMLALFSLVTLSRGLTVAHAEVTFSSTIAPIMHEKCAACHRPQGVAPFPLLTYDDVAKRAEQIEEVTASRYMPPWLPEAQPLAFAENRQLSSSQIAAIREWIAKGKPEGQERVTLPEFPTTWFLGKPDLELEFKDGFPVPEEGTNVFRNFVLPTDIQSAKYIAAYEFRPEPIAAVHHAVILLDPTRQSRELDAADDLPGFPGMVDGRLTYGKFARNETSQVLGWTPGKVPRRKSDLAWKLEPETDLILQLHLQPLGRKADVTAKLGLYYSDHPPQRTPFVIFLSGREIDIPAGDPDYLVEQTYKLPVDVDLRNIYPHAHFICRQMLVTATLPSGDVLQLIRIPDWDFNWHDDYAYAEPVALPSGTVIRMQYRFDNSAENPRNPHQPPRRIPWGEKSDDEMADLALLVVPKSSNQLELLQKDYVMYQQEVRVAWMQNQLKIKPDDGRLMDEIGQGLLILGKPEEAVAFFDKSISVQAEAAEIWVRRGLALQVLGRNADALKSIQKAVELQPKDVRIQIAYAEQLVANGSLASAADVLKEALRLENNNFAATLNLARVHLRQKNDQAAAQVAEAGTRLRPDSAEAWELLAVAQQRLGQLDQSLAALQEAVRLEPGNAELRLKFADLLFNQGRPDEAEIEFTTLLKEDSNHLRALNRLGVIAAMEARWGDSETHWKASLKLDPDQHETLANLARSYAQQGRISDAIECYDQALLTPPIVPTTAIQYAWLRATANDPKFRDSALALRWARYARDHGMMRVPRLWDTLAAAHASAGEFQDAEACIARALNLLPEKVDSEEKEAMLARKSLYAQRKPYVQEADAKGP